MSLKVTGLNFAPRTLSTITRADIAQLFAKIGKDHKVTANRILALVSSVFGNAIARRNAEIRS